MQSLPVERIPETDKTAIENMPFMFPVEKKPFQGRDRGSSRNR